MTLFIWHTWWVIVNTKKILYQANFQGWNMAKVRALPLCLIVFLVIFTTGIQNAVSQDLMCCHDNDLGHVCDEAACNNRCISSCSNRKGGFCKHLNGHNGNFNCHCYCWANYYVSQLEWCYNKFLLPFVLTMGYVPLRFLMLCYFA